MTQREVPQRVVRRPRRSPERAVSWYVCVAQEQLQREPRLFPQLHIADSVTDIDKATFADLTLVDYMPHGKIKMDMAV